MTDVNSRSANAGKRVYFVTSSNIPVSISGLSSKYPELRCHVSPPKHATDEKL